MTGATMNRVTIRPAAFALLALLLMFGGCKGESPTSPPTITPGSGGPGSGVGGVNPPTDAVITLTVSNARPVVNSTSTITASVTKDSAVVPNGTAVEFRTNLGTFQDTGTEITIRTTTNGVASAVLTSGTVGTATVTATVNNVTRSTTVTFEGVPVVPPPPDTSAAITAVTPAFSAPAGGETIVITGRNFREPVRVLFDFGSGVVREGLVTSVTATEIRVITPRVDILTGQTRSATLIVLINAGNTGEQRLTAPTPFVYRAEVLTPVIAAVSPASGPISGGTRTTIFGSAFQEPVQVFFGSAEAQVLNIQFNQLIVMSPTARDTSPNGSGTVTGPVDVRVINIRSNTSTTLTGGFRYTPKMQITAAGPTQGPISGGTRVTIDGIGFDDPVAVSIGGLAAQPIRVSGTQLIAITSAPLTPSCANFSGPIVVTNVENGDSATGPVFTYIAPPVTITTITPQTQDAGQNVTITVINAPPGTARFTIGDRTIFPTGTTVGASSTAFTVPLPTTLTFPTGPCTTAGNTAGTIQLPLTLAVTYLNVETGCTVTLANAITIRPPGATCTSPPAAVVSPSGVAPQCANVGTVASAGPATGSATFTISNTGTQSLLLGVPSANVTNATTATVSPNTAQTVAGGGSVTYTLTVDPAAAGAIGGSVNLSSNDPARPTISVCVSGNGT